MTASLAMRKTFPRRPRKPFAALMTFLCEARAMTPRLTRGMARLLSVRQHRLQGALVRWMGCRRAAEVTLTFLRFNLPLASFLKRFAAPLFVLSFGMMLPFDIAPGASHGRLLEPGQLLV